MRKFLVIAALILALVVPDVAVARVQWREASGEVQGRCVTDARATDGIEIFQRSGAITIRTQKTVQVKVFTILGQLVSQATLPPGTSELKLATHGIYMIKIGNMTQKVAI